MNYTSRHDQPWWSDRSRTDTGMPIHPYPSDHEPEPDLCPGCAGSVDHPLYASRYAENVRLIGQPLTGWHIVCAEMEEQAQAEAQAAIRSEIAATLAMIPSLGGCNDAARA